MKRKLMSIALVLAMALTLLPVSAFAAGETPPTAEDAVKIVRAPLADKDQYPADKLVNDASYKVEVTKTAAEIDTAKKTATIDSTENVPVFTVPVTISAKDVVWHTTSTSDYKGYWLGFAVPQVEGFTTANTTIKYAGNFGSPPTDVGTLTWNAGPDGTFDVEVGGKQVTHESFYFGPKTGFVGDTAHGYIAIQYIDGTPKEVVVYDITFASDITYKKCAVKAVNGTTTTELGEIPLNAMPADLDSNDGFYTLPSGFPTDIVVTMDDGTGNQTPVATNKYNRTGSVITFTGNTASDRVTGDITISAVQEITSVAVDKLAAPEGGTPVDTVDATTTPANGIASTSVTWVEKDTVNAPSPSFVARKTYTAKITLTLAAGFKFPTSGLAEGNVTLGGEKMTATTSTPTDGQYQINGNQIIIARDYLSMPAGSIQTVEVNVAAPTVGEDLAANPNLTATVVTSPTDSASVSTVTWEHVTASNAGSGSGAAADPGTGSGSDAAADPGTGSGSGTATNPPETETPDPTEVFVDGENYKVTIVLTPKVGSKFTEAGLSTETDPVKVDGEKVSAVDDPEQASVGYAIDATGDTSMTIVKTVKVEDTTTPEPPVDNPPTDEPVKVTGVTLEETATLKVNESVTLTATITPADATDKTVTWTSSNADVATVDETGKVTAVAVGTATITVTTTDGEFTAKCEITVEEEGGTVPPPTEVTVPTANITAESVPTVAESIPTEHVEEVTTAAKSVAADETTVGKAAELAAQAVLNDVDMDAQATALVDLPGVTDTALTADQIKPVTVTYMDVTVSDYKLDEGAPTLTMEIQPMMKVVLTTRTIAENATSAEDIDADATSPNQNAIQIGGERKFDVTDTVEVTVTLPQNFVKALAESAKLFVRHNKNSTDKYEYRCSDPDSTGKVTFRNPHGFSPFEFTTTPESQAWIGEVGYADLSSALADVKDGDKIELWGTATSGETSRDLTGLKFTIVDRNNNPWSGELKDAKQTIEVSNGTAQFNGSTPTPPTPGTSSGSGSGSGGGTGVWGGTASSTPRVSVNSGNHGKVTTSSATPKKGDIVTLTITPDSGYELDTLTVTSGGKALDVDIDGNKATFEMPGASVTVKASFRAVGSEPGSGDEPEDLPFADIPEDFWAYNEIAWAYNNGYMNGYSATSFNPSGMVTRQQLWMVLARLSGQNPSDMAAARDWAVSNSVSDGSNPGNAVSRQQMVTMLYRYAQLNDYKTDGGTALSSYPDAGVVQSYATDALSWAVGNGIVNGTADGRLDPEGTAIRSQFAVILFRFCDTVVE